ncbi:MAG: hypothetical protein P8129_14330 [Anaerolineae bacterium]
MNRFRIFVALAIGGLLLAIIVAGPGLAQEWGANSEPDVPLYGQAEQNPVSSSERVPASQAAPPWPDSSGPRAEGGSAPAAPESLPAGIDETTAVADFRILGSVLKPRASDVEWDWGSGGGCIFASAGNEYTIFNTGLYLPQGSEVLAVRMYYNDTSTSDTLGWFSIYDLYGYVVDEWSVPSLGSAGPGFNETELINHVIDYGSYSYALNWRPGALGSDLQLCGFRVFYDPPYGFGSFLPSALNNASAP